MVKVHLIEDNKMVAAIVMSMMADDTSQDIGSWRRFLVMQKHVSVKLGLKLISPATKVESIRLQL